MTARRSLSCEAAVHGQTGVCGRLWKLCFQAGPRPHSRTRVQEGIALSAVLHLHFGQDRSDAMGAERGGRTQRGSGGMGEQRVKLINFISPLTYKIQEFVQGFDKLPQDFSA